MALIEVAASAELTEGGRLVVEVEGRQTALVRVDGVVWAVDNACPHRDGELGRGDLQGHHLYCPLHAWCFDVRTGQAFFPKGATIHRFEVRETAGQISVSPQVIESNG